MGLFERFHLSLAEAEARLGRRVLGDPSNGERAVLVALNSNRLDDVEKALVQDKSLKPDFRELLEGHMRAARQRWSEFNLWTVELPGPVFEAYRGQAWETGGRQSLSDVLSKELELNLSRREVEAAAAEAVRTGDLAPLRRVMDGRPAVVVGASAGRSSVH